MIESRLPMQVRARIDGEWETVGETPGTVHIPECETLELALLGLTEWNCDAYKKELERLRIIPQVNGSSWNGFPNALRVTPFGNWTESPKRDVVYPPRCCSPKSERTGGKAVFQLNDTKALAGERRASQQ
jgi:hypothetical protein